MNKQIINRVPNWRQISKVKKQILRSLPRVKKGKIYNYVIVEYEEGTGWSCVIPEKLMGNGSNGSFALNGINTKKELIEKVQNSVNGNKN